MTDGNISISVEKAKELLGGTKCGYSKEKIASIICAFEELSDSIIDILDEEPDLLAKISDFVGETEQATIKNKNE